ncbi:MAG TPA: sn-glycerol-3-phosphate ABC transporter ATP-binding protein UgpC [Candidatus Kapabacteria bacterium]|nr:sn-glycerol-3-phosphate ABC transporter ATP-binding protein UgpC [Candidatus Kapabacteria bacterium]
MAHVSLQNVWKRFDDGTVAVDDVSFELADGEFLVIVGPSGCGKSTTLRMIAGLEMISEGEIRIGERLVNNVHPKDRDVAMVFQNYALYPHMTVRQNLEFALRMRKMTREEIDRRVARAARMLELEQLMERKPKALSGGQRQRVAVGRAIVRNPAVFLFDEPLSNLDAKLRTQTRAQLQKLHHELRATSVYVTHDQVEAMTMADRIVVMDRGRVQQIAPPMELYNRPVNRFVAGFIGTPGMNFFEGSVTPGDPARFVQSGNAGITIPLAHVPPECAGATTLGIRPEHLLATDPSDPLAFTATVEVVETLGNLTFVYFPAGDDLMAAAIHPDHRPSYGDAIHLRAAADRLHYFQADGTRINPA